METADTKKEALDALTSSQYSAVLLDFDHTLFLDNSTDRYLDALRPRLLAFLLVAASDWIIRALAWFGLCSYNNQRDFMRVLVCTLLMPWNLLWWRAVAAKLAKEKINASLLESLPEDKPVVVVSHGFHHIIKPMLDAVGLSRAEIIASHALPPFRNLRIQGKFHALDHDVTNALFITDKDDEPAEAVAKSYSIEWCPPTPPPFDGYYVPLRYTVEGKYANRRYFTYQILQEDFVLLLLAYAFSPLYVVGLWFLFLSLYAIYEIGYFDNDHIAARKEEKPVVSEAALKFASHPRIKPWVWSFILAACGILPLYYAGDISYSLPTTLFVWLVILVSVYSVFYVFNQIGPRKRILLFPLLHILKTFSFVVILPLTLIGFLLLAAQVLSISTNYLIYRLGGNLEKFNRQLWRTLFFLVCCLGTYIITNPALSTGDCIRLALITVWCSIRTIEAAYHKNILRIFREVLK
jgi:hypothetical protein